MNLPNKLTVLRVILVPVFMLFLCVPLGLSDTLVRVIAAVLFASTSSWSSPCGSPQVLFLST